MIKKLKTFIFIIYKLEEKLWYGKIHRHIFVEEEM